MNKLMNGSSDTEDGDENDVKNDSNDDDVNKDGDNDEDEDEDDNKQENYNYNDASSILFQQQRTTCDNTEDDMNEDDVKRLCNSGSCQHSDNTFVL